MVGVISWPKGVIVLSSKPPITKENMKKILVEK
jgi:hypothetical protein